MKGRPENLNTVQPLRGKLPVKERISRKGQLKNIINKNMAYSKMFILVQFTVAIDGLESQMNKVLLAPCSGGINSALWFFFLISSCRKISK